MKKILTIILFPILLPLSAKEKAEKMTSTAELMKMMRMEGSIVKAGKAGFLTAKATR